MVASCHADDSEIVAESEEQISDRGETDLKDKEEMTAEIEEVASVVEESEPETEAVVIAEGDVDPGNDNPGDANPGAVDPADDDPADDDKDDDEGGDDVAPVDATIDPSEELKRVNAETEQAQAEVLEHSVDVHESVENWGGEPLHVTEVRERVVETIEQAETVIAEKDQKIKELETRIAELEQIETKYNAIIAEEEAKVLAQKQEKARVFAEKQGLDVNEPAVTEAIKALDYSMIAELSMAQVQDEEPEQKDEEPVQRITLASFVELDVGEQNNYGGLLNRRNK